MRIPLPATMAAVAVLAGCGQAQPPARAVSPPTAHVAGIELPVTMRSPGRGQVVMPDLTTDTVGGAELTVRGVGLSWCPPGTAPTSDPAEVGRVIGQSPPVGTVVPAGTKVTVILGAAEQPAAQPASVWHAPVRSLALTSPSPTALATPGSSNTERLDR